MPKQFIIYSLTLLSVLVYITTGAQNTALKTWNPATDGVYAIEGQGWRNGQQNSFARFPAKAANSLRKEVVQLSKHSAGLQLRFSTNAPQIIIRYQVSDPLQMPHMPATGVSGIDLYQIHNNNFLRMSGWYSFKDTIQYNFADLPVSNNQTVPYTLYLPLYNAVKWIEISVGANYNFTPIPSHKKPVVVYGTSIAQGACATRPGLAWTNILGRNLNLPVINLGFSGQGRMEKEVIDLIAEVDASLYIIDCMPNLSGALYTNEVLSKRINYTVQTLRLQHPNVPLLFTDHCGYPVNNNSVERNFEINRVNTLQKKVYDSLVQKGTKGLYYLTQKEIGLDENCIVDYVHPNDLGMMRYAAAYTKKIKQIFKH